MVVMMMIGEGRSVDELGGDARGMGLMK